MTRVKTLMLLSSLVVGGCFSAPLPRPLDAAQKTALMRPPLLRPSVRVTGCRPGASTCDLYVREVTRLFQESQLFSTVAGPGESSDESDLLIEIVAIPRRPYFTRPSHNPGFMLLSVALPFWWSEQYGYRLSARCRQTQEVAEIDTTREGTVLMWSLAPVFNLSSSRGFREDPRREVSQIVLQIEPLLERCRPEPSVRSGVAE